MAIGYERNAAALRERDAVCEQAQLDADLIAGSNGRRCAPQASSLHRQEIAAAAFAGRRTFAR